MLQRVTFGALTAMTLLLGNLSVLDAEPSRQGSAATKCTAPVKNRKSEPTDILIVQLAKGADRDKFDDLLKEAHGELIKTLAFGPDVSFLIIRTEPGTVAEVEAKFHNNKEIQTIQRNLSCHTSELAEAVHDRLGHSHARAERASHGTTHSISDRPSHNATHLEPVHAHNTEPPIAHAPVHSPPPLSPIPNDPLFETEWDAGALNFPLARISGLAINTPVAMYFCDTGVDYQPPEIGTNAIQFNCFDPPNTGPAQEPLFDSGTHGTGTTMVTATTDNAIGYSGVANLEGNRIILVMCRITNGGINTATVEGILTALSFIYQTPSFTAGPINVSVGSAPPTTLNSLQVIQTASQQLSQKGFQVVLAAGNAGAYDSSPELYARRVLALSQDGLRASFSNYGPFTSAAPGDNVPIYVPGSTTGYFGSGTSFAAPRWCAAIAAVMGVLPQNLRTAPYADAIVSATASTTPEGYKIPNMLAAMQMAAAQ